jgi:hypothetical protein
MHIYRESVECEIGGKERRTNNGMPRDQLVRARGQKYLEGDGKSLKSVLMYLWEGNDSSLLPKYSKRMRVKEGGKETAMRCAGITARGRASVTRKKILMRIQILKRSLLQRRTPCCVLSRTSVLRIGNSSGTYIIIADPP